MALYPKLAATASKLLGKYGQQVILRPFAVGGSYDPSKGQSIPVVGVDENRSALSIDAPNNRMNPQYGQTLQNGTLLQRTDKWLYLDSKGKKPTLQDKIVLRGTTYSIIDVQETAPGGVDIMYLLVLRA